MSSWISFTFFALAGLIHLGFFYFESFYLQKHTANAEVRLWAFNQGIYNFCLAIGVFLGLYFVLKKQIMLAGVLTGFCAVTMIIAGVALFFSAPNLRKFALLQALPPFLGLILLYFHIRTFI